jgi:hypothetical protein
MSVSTQTIQSLDQFTKQLYADKVQDLVPDFELLMKGIPFVSAEKQAGGDYVQPVILSRDHGVTFHGKNDAQLKLEAPIAAIIDSASIRPSAMTMRAMLSYTSASRLTGGPRAFVNGTSYIVESLVQSFAAIMEQIHWYGGMGLGKISAVASNTVTISAAEWASGVWVGGEGMLIDVYRAGAKVATTEITQVDIINKQLTLANAAGLLANDVIYRKGSYGLESLGAHYILQNTGSLFGIDASQRKLWEANRYDCLNGALSFEKVSEGIAKAYGRGLLGKMKLYVSPVTFSTMFPDFKTVKSVDTFSSRVFNDESQLKTLEHGVNAIKFFINSVEVEVIASPYVKEGYAFGLSDEGWVRVGSRDLSLGTPGMPEGSYWMQAQDYSALELRAFTDQALFCTKPARQILFYNINNA